VVEAVVDPVADGPVGEQAGETAAHRIEHLGFTLNVQVIVVLAREARSREIFGRGRTANGDRQTRSVFHDEFPKRLADLPGQFVRKCCAVDQPLSAAGEMKAVWTSWPTWKAECIVSCISEAR
jgi:hypothetical protein